MSMWARLGLRTLGTLNAAAVLLGTSFVAESIYRFLKEQMHPSDAPYFPLAFVTMTLIELSFASVLFVTAIPFVQAKLSVANLYSLTVHALLAYFVSVGMLWRARRPVALSIAAATAVSSATTVFTFLFLVPFLYPLASVVLVQLLKRRYSKRAASAIA